MGYVILDFPIRKPSCGDGRSIRLGEPPGQGCCPRGRSVIECNSGHLAFDQGVGHSRRSPTGAQDHDAPPLRIEALCLERLPKTVGVGIVADQSSSSVEYGIDRPEGLSLGSKPI